MTLTSEFMCIPLPYAGDTSEYVQNYGNYYDADDSGHHECLTPGVAIMSVIPGRTVLHQQGGHPEGK